VPYAVLEEAVATIPEAHDFWPVGQVSFLHAPFKHNPLEHVEPFALFEHVFVEVLYV
jgi:hypothetical protein